MWTRTFAMTMALMGCRASSTPEPAPSAHDDTATESGQECCERYGHGSRMVECCQSYSWTAPGECQVPDKHAGGGARVVDPVMCQAATPEAAAAVEDCVARSCVCDPEAVGCEVDTPECKMQCAQKYGGTG